MKRGKTMKKYVKYVVVWLILSFVYFKFVMQPIGDYFFRSKYEVLSLFLLCIFYVVIVLPLTRWSVLKIEERLNHSRRYSGR